MICADAQTDQFLVKPETSPFSVLRHSSRRLNEQSGAAKIVHKDAAKNTSSVSETPSFGKTFVTANLPFVNVPVLSKTNVLT